MNGSGLPRAVQNNWRQEQLLALGFRQVLARHVLVIVTLMGHIITWGSLLNIRENFRRKACKPCCQWELSRCLSHHLFSCLCSCTRRMFSSKPTAHLLFMHQGGTEEMWKKLGVVVPRTVSGKLERRLYSTVNHRCFNAWRSMFSLPRHMESVSSYRQHHVSGTWTC